MQRLGLSGFLMFLVACTPGEPDSAPDPGVGTEASAQVSNQASELYVAAEYDTHEIRLHYRLEVDNPSWYHRYWRFHDGRWHIEGEGTEGPDPNGLYEDRISMLLDDGSVQGFDRFGGFMLVHPGMRSLNSAAPADEVRAHSLLGEAMGRTDVRKYLPQSRNGEYYSDPARWDDTKTPEAIETMQRNGEFLDLWQWRAHRSNPLGYADNGYVLHSRLASGGRSMFVVNQDAGHSAPAFMYDPNRVGRHALRWEALKNRDYTQEDPYFLSEETAIVFDPSLGWQEGDVLPYYLLQTPNGARGALKAAGHYDDGQWRVTLTRTLTSPNAMDSKALEPGGIYHVAFAVHHGGVGARHHRVSLPHSLGLGVDADIVATETTTPLSDDDLNWVQVGLVYPHQVTWEWLVTRHQGANFIRGDMPIGVRDQHGHTPALQRYLDRFEQRRQQFE